MRIEIGSDITGRVCIVVDVLRASSTIVTLLERGCERVVIAADIEEARKLRERLPDHLLCGEVGGLPPEGFDYGNSAVEFSRLDLTGKSVILATTNGTRVLARAANGAAAVFVGCLLNRTAVADAAEAMAQKHNCDVSVICASDEDDDLAAADAIAHVPPDAGVILRVRVSPHAEKLRAIGLGEDVDYCAQVDVSGVVPLLQPGEDGLLVLRPM